MTGAPPRHAPSRPTAPGRGARLFTILASPAARLPLAALGALIVTGTLTVLDLPAARITGVALLALTGLPVAWATIRGMFRGHFASDIVATLAILTAIALQQPIAGLVIVLMQTGGELLDRYAEGRASAAVRELEAQAPQIAHRVRGTLTEDIAADEVAVGDDVWSVRSGQFDDLDTPALRPLIDEPAPKAPERRSP